MGHETIKTLQWCESQRIGRRGACYRELKSLLTRSFFVLEDEEVEVDPGTHFFKNTYFYLDCLLSQKQNTNIIDSVKYWEKPCERKLPEERNNTAHKRKKQKTKPDTESDEDVNADANADEFGKFLDNVKEKRNVFHSEEEEVEKI